MSAATLETLIARLAEADAGVRRTAILDLIARSRTEPEAAEALLSRLPCETDERAALLIIRHFGRELYIPAIPALWSLYAGARTPAAIAHAAIVEHDRILGSTARR